MSELFDCINAINNKNKEYKYNKKHVSGYMLLMWFSHEQDCIGIIQKINKYVFDLSDDVIYHYLYNGIPKNRRFIKWDKGMSSSLSDKDKESISYIKNKYGFSKEEAMKLYILYIK